MILKCMLGVELLTKIYATDAVGKRNLTAPSLGVRLGDPSLRHRIGLFWLIPGMATRGYFIIYLVLLQWWYGEGFPHRGFSLSPRRSSADKADSKYVMSSTVSYYCWRLAGRDSRDDIGLDVTRDRCPWVTCRFYLISPSAGGARRLGSKAITHLRLNLRVYGAYVYD